MIKLWWHRFKTKRIDYRFVDYAEGDKLIRAGWELAKEEDFNTVPFMVHVELRE